MEAAHPGLIELSDEKKEMVEMRKEFAPLEKLDENTRSTHTPEYDQVTRQR